MYYIKVKQRKRVRGRAVMGWSDMGYATSIKGSTTLHCVHKAAPRRDFEGELSHEVVDQAGRAYANGEGDQGFTINDSL